jgi:hypothetical protein
MQSIEEFGESCWAAGRFVVDEHAEESHFLYVENEGACFHVFRFSKIPGRGPHAFAITRTRMDDLKEAGLGTLAVRSVDWFDMPSVHAGRFASEVYAAIVRPCLNRKMYTYFPGGTTRFRDVFDLGDRVRQYVSGSDV